MKKFIYSLSMAALFGIYVFAGRTFWANNSGTADVSSNSQTLLNQPVPTPTIDQSQLDARGTASASPTSSDTPTPIATAPAPTAKPTLMPTPIPTKPAGQYADGTYTGSRADAYYGYIQVRAVISGGKLTQVQFLEYPSDRGESRRINERAIPYLQQEAITAQSANVDIVSGATDSSNAFIESLGNALSQAKNG